MANIAPRWNSYSLFVALRGIEGRLRESSSWACIHTLSFAHTRLIPIDFGEQMSLFSAAKEGLIDGRVPNLGLGLVCKSSFLAEEFKPIFFDISPVVDLSLLSNGWDVNVSSHASLPGLFLAESTFSESLCFTVRL